MAGKAAVIEVVAVPSHQKDSHLDAAPDEVINSHIDLRPENCDLPPFEDCKPLLLLPNDSNAVSLPLILVKSIGLELQG